MILSLGPTHTFPNFLQKRAGIFRLFFLMLVAGSFLQLRAEEKKELGPDLIIKAMSPMHKASAVQMLFTKRTKSPYLLKEKTSEGKLIFSKGKMKLTQNSPLREQLILNGKVLWHVQFPEDGKNQKMQVTRFDLKTPNRSTNVLLAFLFEDESIWSKLNVKSLEEVGGRVKHILIPKRKEDFPDIAEIRVSIDKTSLALVGISYTDELENLIEFEFKETKLGVSTKKMDFEYKPPKGIEVIRYP